MEATTTHTFDAPAELGGYRTRALLVGVVFLVIGAVLAFLMGQAAGYGGLVHVLRSYLVGFTGLKNGSEGLDIPPNSVTHTEGFTLLKENTVITNFQPHFHLRGKAMQVEAIFPDGRTQIVSYVKDFNFNWMTNYIYTDEAAPVFPKGTIIHVTAFYDNTKGNKDNPDPDQWVGYGDRTVDEMAHAWMNVVYLTDEEYQERIAKYGVGVTNGVKPQTQTQQQQQ